MTIYNDTQTKKYGISLSPLLCSENTAYVYIEHEDNPLTLFNVPEEQKYSLVNTPEEYFRIIKANIDAGYPVIINIKSPSTNTYFNYTTNGHYVLVIGAYVDSNDNDRIVVADPHYKTVYSGSSQCYALIDLPFDDYYEVYKASGAVIRNVLWG